jgi:Na+/alanine symporter
MVCAFLMLPAGYFKNFKISILLKCIFAGLVMYGTIWTLQSVGLFWIMQALIGAVIYTLLIITLHVISRQELRFLREFFSRKKLKSIISLKKQEQ